MCHTAHSKMGTHKEKKQSQRLHHLQLGGMASYAMGREGACSTAWASASMWDLAALLTAPLRSNRGAQ